MMTIGPHLSIAGGYERLGKHALALGASTLAFFTRNPRGGAAKAIDEGDAAAFVRLTQANRFGTLVAHAPYTLNPASKTQQLREWAHTVLVEDLARMEYTPGNCYNLHPGAHVGQGADVGIAHTASLLSRALAPGQSTTVLLETMSGSGTELGATFEELAQIIGQVDAGVRGRVGVCLDTCHVWAAGYDIAGDLDGVLRNFDDTIGLARLKAVHLNDCQFGLGLRKDRHAGIGKGAIGEAAIGRVIRHEALRHLPFILETPNDDAGWAAEIALLRGLYAQG